MLEYFSEMIKYNSTVNLKLCNSLKDQSIEVTGEALKLLSHLLTAEKIWMMRMLNKDQPGNNFWPELSVYACELLVENNRKSYEEFLSGINENELNNIITYKNSKGIEFNTSVGDILTHVTIHSAYHRGQVAMRVRQKGGEPFNTDYINYVRYLK